MNTIVIIILLLAGIVIGIFCMNLIQKIRDRFAKKKELAHESSTAIMSEIEYVFKIVLIDFHYSKIHEFKDKESKFLQRRKKALLTVNARVSIGFDFNKSKDDLIIDENNHVKLKKIPEPEIISITPKYNYYDVAHGWFNKFSIEDSNEMEKIAYKDIEENSLTPTLADSAKKQLLVLLKNRVLNGSVYISLPEKVTEKYT